MILLLLLTLSLLATLLYGSKLRQVALQAPQVALLLGADPPEEPPKIAVIVPAYNEAQNVEVGLSSILDSTSLSADHLQVWLVDDQSTDGTGTIAQQLQQQRQDPRLKVLRGQPKPEGEIWVGKNWACTQAADQAEAEYLLFLDADVQLQPGAIEAAIRALNQEQIDLLSCAPAFLCGCVADWVVEPLIISTLMVGFDFGAVNDPTTDSAFAVGAFMLFRRSAYEKIGGHRSVADQPVEDVELARRVKFGGLKLKYALGSELAGVLMYRSWQDLWEGWTKNMYPGSQRNLRAMVQLAILMLLVCTVPWIGFILALGQGVGLGWDWLTLSALGLALVLIASQYGLRRVGTPISQISPRYWWLTGLGGIAVAAIALGSVIKTETGWGWTWRGRSLKSAEG